MLFSLWYFDVHGKRIMRDWLFNYKHTSSLWVGIQLGQQSTFSVSSSCRQSDRHISTILGLLQRGRKVVTLCDGSDLRSQ